jgi:signal transduction histidine kinase
MICPEDFKLNTKWSNGIEYLVPKMTSSILDGIRTCTVGQETENNTFRHSKAKHPLGVGQGFRIPLTAPSVPHGTKDKAPHSTADARKVFVIHHDPAQKQSVRSFIGGLSHCYNNLLMGIWGYASLMGMILDKGHPLQPHIGKMEALIQQGSNLIHLLFGYLVERRAAAKRLRLNQLIQEVKAYQQQGSSQINLPIFKTGIIRMSKIGDRHQLAMCLSPVIAQLMALVQKECEAMAPHCHDLKIAGTHLHKIDKLIRRGLILIRDLDFYAGSILPKTKPVCLTSIVRRQARHLDNQQAGVKAARKIAPNLPKINVDAEQIEYALAQLTANAVDAVDGNGAVQFSVNTMNDEIPSERCGVHALNNYVVLTVSDNGKGMSTTTQAQIFDPFYTAHSGQGKAGLGLSAAAQIVKAHSGYLQVRSQPGKGSMLKMYLPF